MEDASFRPTWRQAAGHGLYLGAITAAVFLVPAVLAGPPIWAWALLAFGPPLAGAAGGLAAGRWAGGLAAGRWAGGLAAGRWAGGLAAGRRAGGEICAGGIRTSSGLAPWHRVVDLREERRGGRTVVSVYLDSGASLVLRAPYSGGLFAADPRFEVKMFALSYMWRSRRFGGLPG